MKPLVLALLLIFASAGLVWFSQSYSSDPTSPNRVHHPAGTMLAVYFAHADHMDQSCIACHHNYVDDTGSGMCFDCHKTDQEVAALIETQFHDLCRGCHIDEQAAGHEHGPTRHCVACHIPDTQP